MGRVAISLVLASLLTASSAPSWAAGEFYCCHDAASGRQVCGDSVPAQCRGKSYRMLDSGGNLIREVGPPLTAEQKAEQAIEAKRRKQQEEVEREARRRDLALLDTYATSDDIDLAQKKAEADVNLAIQAAKAQIEIASAKLKKLQAEAEFYRNKAMPGDLARSLHAVEYDIKLQQELIAIKQKEYETIKTKYDGDRKRYYELTRRPPSGPTGTR